MAYKNAQSKAATKYNALSTVGFTVRLNAKTDADIIAALESVENKNALIKTLLRNYIDLRAQGYELTNSEVN